MIRDKKHWEWMDTFIPEHINLLESYEYYIADDREATEELQIYIHTKDNERWYNFISQRFDVWGDAYSWAEEIVGKLQEEYPDKELGAEEILYLTEAIYDRDESNYEKCILQYAHNLTFTWRIPNATLSERVINRNSVENFVEELRDHEVLRKIPFGAMLDIYSNVAYEGDFIIGFRLDRETIEKLLNAEKEFVKLNFKNVFFGVWNYELGAGYVDKIDDLHITEVAKIEDLEIDDVYGIYKWSAEIYEGALDNTKIILK